MERLFSLVVPTWNVERYLGDFLDSLTNQTYGIDNVEIMFVDDGSTDSSADLISKWIASVAPAARLLQKDNGGLATARNFGLDRATGRWITFCDPDDTLPPNYFGAVAAFVEEHHDEDLSLLACRLLMLDDHTGELRDEHPLRLRFEHGNRVVDLEHEPHCFHLDAASAFYRRDLIERRGLRFDPRIRPNFEDAHFTSLYLADENRPKVALLSDPAYHYRRRRDSSSLVQDSWNDPAKYSSIPRFGYLDLFQRYSAQRGSVPRWLQNLVLYDLLWYFKHDERIHSKVGSVDIEAAREFHETLPEVMRYIDTATVENYSITAASPEIRNALIIGAKGERQRPDRVRLTDVDVDQRLTQVRYFYGGELPREEFRSGGSVVAPVYGKSRGLIFLGKRLASERIAWLPADDSLEISLDGRHLPIDRGGDRRATPVVQPKPTLRHSRLGARSLARRVARSWKRNMAPEVRIKRRATGHRGRRYRNAWVFTDRNRLAQDNAEHLYRFVRTNHPEINSWFVVDRDTNDWPRLERDGFRLVEYGTTDHLLLMLNCVELISSQIDHYIVYPVDTRRFGRQRWRFTFLQHGVSKDDLSRWVNRKPISRLITATEAEYQSFVGDGTPYVFTDREVRLTGLPRHDRLLRIAEDPHVVASGRLLLIMPTWRRELVGEANEPGGDREAHPGFWESSYAKSWLELLESERLGELADRAGLRCAFMPHPDMESFLSRVLPDHVEVHRHADVDIQRIIARGAAIITDYSSNAFELAYLNRPVIYFQFDRDRFFSGQHVYRRGTWSYLNDGFGPVVDHTSTVLDELQRLIESGMTPQDPYATRIQTAFAFRDGNSCERVFESILEARRPAETRLSRRRPRR